MSDSVLLAEFRKLVQAVFPTSPFWVPRRFRVIRMHTGDQRVELQAVRKTLGFPDILPISMAPGMAGLTAKLTPGCEVLVSFVDGDPAQPLITHFAAPDAAGWLPVEVVLDASSKVTVGASAGMVEVGSGSDVVADPTKRFVCWGDSVVFPGPGTAPLTAAPGTATAKAGRP